MAISSCINHELLTGKLTGTPTDFNVQSRTSVNKTPLQEPLGGRPRTATDSRCRIPPFGTQKNFRGVSSKARSGLRLFCLRGNMQLTGKLTGTRSLTLAHHSFQLLHTSP